MKVGDLVRMPDHRMYWWGGQVGIVDMIEPMGSQYVKYRVFIAGNAGKGYAKFGDPEFVEVISESR